MVTSFGFYIIITILFIVLFFLFFFLVFDINKKLKKKKLINNCSRRMRTRSRIEREIINRRYGIYNEETERKYNGYPREDIVDIEIGDSMITINPVPFKKHTKLKVKKINNDFLKEGDFLIE